MRKPLTTACLSILFLSLSCVSKTNKPQSTIDNFALENTGSISLPLYEKCLPQTDAMFPYQSNGLSFLAYLNSAGNEILVFDLASKKLAKKIKFDVEGPQGVGKIRGFMMVSPDTLFITPSQKKTIYVADSSGSIIDQIPYTNFTNGEPVGMSFYSRSDFSTPLIRAKNKFYLGSAE